MLAAASIPQLQIRQARRTVKKWVYFFGAGKAEGDGTWRDLLGGKGAGLAEMTKIGLPVPAGFTISTEVCDYFYKNGKKYPPELKKQVADNVAKLERITKKRSEEHTSELQSRQYLVCRLLLEKKKKAKKQQERTRPG